MKLANRSSVCALLAATSLLGAVATPAAAGEAASPAAKACSARYIKSLRMEEMMKSMMDSMVPAMSASMPGGDVLDADDKQAIADLAVESTMAIVPEMIADIEPLLVKHFSEAEVCAMADFYDSPTGRAIIGKMPAFTAETGALTMKYVPRMQQEMLDRLCKRIDCEGTSKKTKGISKAS